MLKFFATLLIIVIVVIGASFIYVNIHGAQYASEYLSKTLDLPVSIESVHPSWKSIEFKHVNIKSPEGSTTPSVFKADHINLQVELTSFFKKVIQIHEIYIENATIGIYMENLSGSENNWEEILNHLFAYDSTEKTKQTKKVIINKLIVDNLGIQTNHQLFGPYTVLLQSIPHIELENLTANTPITIAEALNVLFHAILSPLGEKEGFNHIFDNVEELPPSLEEIFSQHQTTISNTKESKGWTKLKEGLQEIFDETTQFFKALFH